MLDFRGGEDRCGSGEQGEPQEGTWHAWVSECQSQTTQFQVLARPHFNCVNLCKSSSLSVKQIITVPCSQGRREDQVREEQRPGIYGELRRESLCWGQGHLYLLQGPIPAACGLRGMESACPYERLSLKRELMPEAPWRQIA